MLNSISIYYHIIKEYIHQKNIVTLSIMQYLNIITKQT